MKFNDFRCLCGIVCCMALIALTGCRTASPKPVSQSPAYGGLMSDRGIVPPASAQHRSAMRPARVAPASVEPLPPANEPLFVPENDFDGPVVPDVVDVPADTVTPVQDEVVAEQPAVQKTRELPHLENGRAVPNLPGAPANRRGGASSTTTATATPTAGNNVYVVKKGDSLSKIAKAHNVTAADIMALNPSVTSADKIMVGQSLKMPANATGAGLEAAPVVTAVPADGLYTVQSGDSLWTIGKRFGVKREDIKAWNNLTSDKLKVGQQLRLKADASQPAKKALAPAPAPAPEPEPVAPAPAVVETPAPAAVPEPPVEPAAAPALEPAPETDEVVYQIAVVEGETLEAIAEANAVTVESILKYNPQVKSNDDLVSGMNLMIHVAPQENPPAQQ